MLALLTSCGREDLLKETIYSFRKNLINPEFIDLIIHEDHQQGSAHFENTVITGGLGQHKSIEKFIMDHKEEKCYLHLEDDWTFDNQYNWIVASLKIMMEDPSIIKVLARKDSPHPCNYKYMVNGQPYGILEPWQNTDSIWWCGFSWNPGITRLDLLKKFIPFPRWEQDLGLAIHDAGYKVAVLKNPVYEHIGDGRSTHSK